MALVERCRAEPAPSQPGPMLRSPVPGRRGGRSRASGSEQSSRSRRNPRTLRGTFPGGSPGPTGKARASLCPGLPSPLPSAGSFHLSLRGEEGAGSPQGQSSGRGSWASHGSTLKLPTSPRSPSVPWAARGWSLAVRVGLRPVLTRHASCELRAACPRPHATSTAVSGPPPPPTHTDTQWQDPHMFSPKTEKWARGRNGRRGQNGKAGFGSGCRRLRVLGGGEAGVWVRLPSFSSACPPGAPQAPRVGTPCCSV